MTHYDFVLAVRENRVALIKTWSRQSLGSCETCGRPVQRAERYRLLPGGLLAHDDCVLAAQQSTRS